MSETPPLRRLVFNFSGFEPLDATQHLERMTFHAGKSARVWGYTIERGGIEAQERSARADFTAVSPNWRTETRFVQFDWRDIVAGYAEGGVWRTWTRHLPQYLAFITDGTTGRYRRAALRYWAFSIYPFVALLLFAALAWWLTGFLTGALGLVGVGAIALRLVATVAVTVGLSIWPGHYIYLLHAIDDWGFARDMVNRVNPEIEARFDRFAARMAEEALAFPDAEIIVVGHSFGAIWATGALARALDDPALAGRPVSVLALGSSVPKIALVPKADWLRDHVEMVLADKRVDWFEVQSKDDIIAFYKSDLRDLLNLDAPDERFRVDYVRWSRFMERARYRKMRRSFYRTHRQYLFYLDQRSPFDLPMRLFGPLPAKALAREPSLVETLTADGSIAGEA